MNWTDFKTQLAQNPELHLQFEFAENQRVNPSFHITEIKQANITSVDCGGKMNAWTEVIVQLWEPNTNETERPMKVSKAMSIIDLVEKTLPLNPNSPVKIEFGNDSFETRQMHPQDFQITNDEIIVKLTADKTECKAIGRGQTCGTPKEKVKLSEIQNSCCTPDSGCC
ncbi:DUF6428 family protein [Flavobacterium sp.]|uniref:DUF6428 family protein n=1 Tax=Flavobacterium sp. TaxID=239 RepID=UPI002B4B6130|nr:DUF6428 family protein [Flavobacterium sp.]HLF50653.1 DUF6428 family protein [Flavobacterium sp.]